MKSRESILQSMRSLPLPPCFDCRLCAGTTVITVGGSPLSGARAPVLGMEGMPGGEVQLDCGRGVDLRVIYF
jgi:hypothetical protein